MNNVNKTLYIPLYGKAYVSRKGLFLKDEYAEKIWEAEKFPLKGKSKSKWLAYYMGIRSAVFDEWLKAELERSSDAVVIHIGCGMDARIARIGEGHPMWYDVDFPEVIAERRRYFEESEDYKMLAADIRDSSWLDSIKKSAKAIVVMEGVSMYIAPEDLRAILQNIAEQFSELALLMDCYTVFAAKMSKYKNPINDVGVSVVYGIDDPSVFATGGIIFSKELEMTPGRYIDELHGVEKWIFARLYAGNFAKKLYKLYEYRRLTV